MNRELLELSFDNGITVEEMIKRLSRFPKDYVIVNNCKDHDPITDIMVGEVDYCVDNEIITKKVVGVY